MPLFLFSVFSDRRSLKIEYGNNNTKILTAEFSYIELGSLELSLHRNFPWLAGTPFTRTNCHGPKPFRVRNSTVDIVLICHPDYKRAGGWLFVTKFSGYSEHFFQLPKHKMPFFSAYRKIERIIGYTI